MRLYGSSAKEVGTTFEQDVRAKLARLCMPEERIEEFMAFHKKQYVHPTGFDGIEWDHDIGLYHVGRQEAVFSPVQSYAAAWVGKNYNSDWYLPVLNAPYLANYRESDDPEQNVLFMKEVVDEWERKRRVPLYPDDIKEYMRNRK